jgi:hypothetical protein
MNKRQLHHRWKRIRYIRPWYFLILAIVSAVVCVYALRANNEHMIVLRDAVYAADEDNADVQGRLRALQAYVTTHMNTALSAGPNAVYPPIQLKYTYDRLVQSMSDQTAKANSQIYTDAQAYCEGLNSTDFSGHNRVPCIEQYVQSHTNKTATVPDDLYKFSFASPLWSPDLAGWSMVIAASSGIMFVVSALASRWYRRNIA